ncbi:hypothetical protein ANCCEY_07891 [Ancylostoma ceylanicum]|uniref:Reverse transcriptase domain-containing protein n=1 Tax=Ancylostoma ceylanicum TaxID=53326 RepID=A0A0D6LZI9_9BILA|nr:hypothetical protein ANCCEY_07891 [Ancylostoma ceylanicum]
MFADDVKMCVMYSENNSLDANLQLQVAIDKLVKYMSDWQLELSSKKTFALYLGRNNRKRSYFLTPDTVITKTDNVKDLGVHCDETICFNKHNQMVKRSKVIVDESHKRIVSR